VHPAPTLPPQNDEQVNGKKLVPSSVVVLRFMAPLVLWAAAVVVVFGVSFTQLANLQGPLSSLNAAAHVTYRISRVRLMGNFLAFSETNADNDRYRADLLDELGVLRKEVCWGGWVGGWVRWVGKEGGELTELVMRHMGFFTLFQQTSPPPVPLTLLCSTMHSYTADPFRRSTRT